MSPSLPSEIDPVPRANVDSAFQYAATHPPHVRQVADLDPQEGGTHPVCSSRVEALYAESERASASLIDVFPDFYHGHAQMVIDPSTASKRNNDGRLALPLPRALSGCNVRPTHEPGGHSHEFESTGRNRFAATVRGTPGANEDGR